MKSQKLIDWFINLFVLAVLIFAVYTIIANWNSAIPFEDQRRFDKLKEALTLEIVMQSALAAEIDSTTKDLATISNRLNHASK
ncbi:MAG TPA: hypothetical protein VH413_16135 [Verrucomicrobiae bacterium]|jgi:hypothetical protein|nr:hypothetical protein [Verrucomicrobiae bacterium]